LKNLKALGGWPRPPHQTLQALQSSSDLLSSMLMLGVEIEHLKIEEAEGSWRLAALTRSNAPSPSIFK
jgi:hypothetical protein